MNRFKLFKIFCLILSVAAACYYPAKKVIQYEFSPATEFDFKVEGYDPYDPGRGHYLRLTIHPAKPSIDEKLLPNNFDNKPRYATVAKDKDGFATVTGFVDAPGETPCFKSATDYITRFSFRGIYPFTRFYINEKIAHDAEVLLQDAVKNGQRCVLRVKLFADGATAVTGLLIDGKDIRELVRGNKAAK